MRLVEYEAYRQAVVIRCERLILAELAANAEDLSSDDIDHFRTAFNLLEQVGKDFYPPLVNDSIKNLSEGGRDFIEHTFRDVLSHTKSNIESRCHEIVAEISFRSSVRREQKYEIRAAKTPVVAPPAMAEFLLTLLVNPKKREGILGDFNERFQEKVETVGSRRARIHYWASTMRSVCPLLWEVAKKVGIFGLLVSAFKRLSGG